MKISKKVLCFVLIIFLLIFAGCDKDIGKKDDNQKPDDGIEQIDEAQDPNHLGGMKYKYTGDWEYTGDYSYAGLYEKDGTIHTLPEENKTIGKSINITHYGAVANDKKVDNTAAVKAAIASAKEGDEIYIPAGTYYFKTQSLANPVYSHINLKSGVNLRGDGDDKTILVSAFPSYNNLNNETATISIINSSNITISDLKITAEVPEDAMPTNLSTTQNNPEGNQYAPVYGIYGFNTDIEEATSNIVIKNCLVEYFQTSGIQLTNTIDCTVKDSIVQNATDIGGGGAGYAVLIQGKGNESFNRIGTNVDSRYNVVENVTVNGPYIRHGIIFSYVSHNNLVYNCTVNESQDEAYDLHGEDEFLNVMTNNKAVNINSNGFGLGNGGSTHDATGPGNIIYGNEIIGSRGGISIVYGTPDSLIYNNIIKELQPDSIGININYGPNSKVVSNTINDLSGKSTGIVVNYNYVWDNPANGLSLVNIKKNTITKCETGIYLFAYKEGSIFTENNITECTNDFVDLNSSFVLPPSSDYFTPVTGTNFYPTQEGNINRGSWDTVVSNTGYFWFKGSEEEPGFNRMIFYEWDLKQKDIDAGDKIYLRLTFTSKSAKQHFFFWGIENLDWDATTLTWGNAPFVNNCINNSNLKEDPTGIYSTDDYPYAAKVYDPNTLLNPITDLEAVSVSEEFLTYYINITDYIKSLESTNFTMILSNETMDGSYSSIRNMKGNSKSLWPSIIIAK